MVISKKIPGFFDPSVFVTSTLIVLNGGVFTGLMVSGGIDASSLLRFGAQYGPLIWQGEYWRILTTIFLHFNLLHLLFNMYALYILGGVVEPILGARRFFSLYLFSGLAGSIVSISFNPDFISVGASGAVFGAAGASLALWFYEPRPLRKKFLEPSGFFLLAFVVYNVIFGFVQSGIDNAAHIGGLFTGTALGYYFIVRVKDDARRLPFARILYLLFSFFFALSVLYSMRPIFNPGWHVWYAEQLYNLGEMELAEKSYRRAVEMRPRNAIYRRELGRFLILEGEPDNALREFNAAIPSAGDQGLLSYLSGVAALAMNDEKILWDCYSRARKNGYFNHRILILLGNYYSLIEQWDNALDAFLRAIRLDPNDPMSYQALLFHLTRYGEEENRERLEYIRKEINQGETSSTLHLRFLGAYYRHFRRFDLALESYEKARDKLVENRFISFDIAYCLYKMNRLEEAEREINLLLASFPDTSLPELNLPKNIILMMKIKIVKDQRKDSLAKSLRWEIEENYRAVLKKERNMTILNNLAYHLAEENYKIDEAVEMAREAAQKNPAAYVLDTLAWCYFRKGRYPEALEAMNHAIDRMKKDRLLKYAMTHLDGTPEILAPDDGDREYFYHLGAILAAMGKKKEASASLEKALRNHADFDDYEKARDLHSRIENKNVNYQQSLLE